MMVFRFAKRFKWWNILYSGSTANLHHSIDSVEPRLDIQHLKFNIPNKRFRLFTDH